VGTAVFLLTCFVETYWRAHLTKETESHAHDYENDMDRKLIIDKHTVVGWYGDSMKFKDADGGRRRMSVEGPIEGVAGDQTIVLEQSWTDLGGANSPQMLSLKEVLREEIASVMNCAKGIVLLKQVEKLSDKMLQMHLQFFPSNRDADGVNGQLETRKPQELAYEFQMLYQNNHFKGFQGVEKLRSCYNVEMGYRPHGSAKVRGSQMQESELAPSAEQAFLPPPDQPEEPPARAPVFMRSVPSETQKSWNSSAPLQGPLFQQDSVMLRPEDVQVTYAGVPSDYVDRATRVPTSLKGPGHPPHGDALDDNSPFAPIRSVSSAGIGVSASMQGTVAHRRDIPVLESRLTPATPTPTSSRRTTNVNLITNP